MTWVIASEKVGTPVAEEPEVSGHAASFEDLADAPAGRVHAVDSRGETTACGMPLRQLTMWPDEWPGRTDLDLCPGCGETVVSELR